MAYSDFDLKTVRERFALIVDEETNLFTAIEAVPVSTWLCDFLDDGVAPPSP